MARVTVEDCMEQEGIHDRFELVVLASKRAKDICSGAHITIENDNEKSAVVALREIAAGKIDVQNLREMIVESQMYSSKSKHGDEDIVLDEDDHKDEILMNEVLSHFAQDSEDDDMALDEEDDYFGEESLDLDPEDEE